MWGSHRTFFSVVAVNDCNRWVMLAKLCSNAATTCACVEKENKNPQLVIAVVSALFGIHFELMG